MSLTCRSHLPHPSRKRAHGNSCGRRRKTYVNRLEGFTTRFNSPTVARGQCLDEQDHSVEGETVCEENRPLAFTAPRLEKHPRVCCSPPPSFFLLPGQPCRFISKSSRWTSLDARKTTKLFLCCNVVRLVLLDGDIGWVIWVYHRLLKRVYANSACGCLGYAGGWGGSVRSG